MVGPVVVLLSQTYVPGREHQMGKLAPSSPHLGSLSNSSSRLLLVVWLSLGYLGGPVQIFVFCINNLIKVCSKIHKPLGWGEL